MTPPETLHRILSDLHTAFRGIGLTLNAAAYPLSDNGKAVKATFNGVPVDKLPFLMGYAPNAGMHEWYETCGELMARGKHVVERGWLKILP